LTQSHTQISGPIRNSLKLWTELKNNHSLAGLGISNIRRCRKNGFH
jgi:hypothetical protein